MRYASIFQLCKHWLRPDEVSKITLREVELSTGTDSSHLSSLHNKKNYIMV
jgi:hypothetical protein